MTRTVDTNRLSEPSAVPTNAVGERAGLWNHPAFQAYQLLHLGFTIAPIVAGLDKFFHWLVNWDQYLAPLVNHLVGGHGHAFMLVVGVIEIIAGLGVALKPRIFAYVVTAWLVAIIVNLLLIPG